MPKLKIDTRLFADEMVVMDAIAAVQSQASGKGPFPAEVVRDSGGKVVQVIIGVPDSEQANLGNMQAKITENPGVASVVTFPVLDSNDFETGADGDNVTSLGVGHGNLNLFQSATKLRTANAIAGTKSLNMEYTQGAVSQLTHEAEATFSSILANDYSVGAARVMVMSGKFQNVTGTRGNVGFFQSIRLPIYHAEFRSRNGGTYQLNIQNGFSIIDTGITQNALLDWSVKVDSIIDEITVRVDGIVIYQAGIGFPFSSTIGSGITLTKQDRFSAAQTHTMSNLLLDDWDFKILA